MPRKTILPKQIIRRAYSIFFIFIIGYLVLVYRIIDIQFIDSDLYQEKIENQNPDHKIPILKVSQYENEKIDLLKTIEGVIIDEVDSRVYQNSEALGCLIGYTDNITKEELEKHKLKEIEEFFNSFVPEELIPENTINHKLFDLAEQRLMKQSQKKLKEISGLMTDTELNAVSKVKDSIYNLNENEWALITAEKGFTYWDILIPLCDPATRIIIDSHMSEGRILQYLWYPRMPKDGEIQKCCDSYFQVIREIREEQKRKMNADEVILEILEMDKKDIGTAIKEEYYSNTHNTIALALKGVTEQVVERLLDSVDKRTAMYIRDEMELMGPVKITEVEQAQKVLKMDVMGLEVARSLKKQK